MITVPPLNWPQGLSAGRFLAEYWQQKPLLLRKAFAGFENPLSPDELAGLALEHDIHSRLILQQSDTVWHLRNGPFSEQELSTLPAQGWSLLVSDIEKHLDGFHRYLQPFRFIPDWQVDDLMISYAPQGASVGAHIDEYDVFLLQASGRREWQIDSSGNADRVFLPDLDIKILQHFQADCRWVLEAGDMLYLPPGVPHHGISLDNDCMTWSIGFRAIAHADLLGDIARQLASALPDTARYTDASPPLQPHAAEIPAQTLDELRTLWQELVTIAPAEFNRMAGNALSRRDDFLPTADWQHSDELDTLLANEAIVRDPASRLLFTTGAATTWLHADGQAYPLCRELACLLCDSFDYPVDQLREHLQQADNRDCLLALWRRGILRN